MTARTATAPGGPRRQAMDRIIDAIEWCAATFVGIVALNIFLAVVLRKFFAWQIPDSYDIGKMLLGTLIFWGIAATSYRGSHITVDLLWTAASAPWKRRIDVFATTVLLFVVTVQTIMLFDKVRPEIDAAGRGIRTKLNLHEIGRRSQPRRPR